jgi:hypothetical protein
MSDDMQEIKITLPGVYEAGMRHIHKLYPMDDSQKAMIALTIGSCILQAKDQWEEVDYEKLEMDLISARKLIMGS